MGNMARAKVAAIPIPHGQIDPERVSESMMTSAPETPAPSKSATESHEEPKSVSVAALPPPEPEVVPTVSLRDIARILVKQITRERLITAALGCISIGALFLVWYLGTKYRFEFYIRFKNVPTPAEVFNQLTQVGLSNKYLVNIAISVRRILT